jgi:hypothetical protein
VRKLKPWRLFGSQRLSANNAAVAEVTEAPQRSTFFLKRDGQKPKAQTRSGRGPVEEDEVRVGYIYLTELTIAQVRDSEDLMSVDGLDPKDSDSETEIRFRRRRREEEWGGTGGGGEVDPSPSSGKPVKVPAGHELREMKEASELYKSSAFKLQVRIQCNPSVESPA